MSKLHLKNSFKELSQTGRVQIECQDFVIDLQLAEGHKELFLSTAVFDGGNYIPKSVRRCLKADFLDASNATHKVSLMVDEDRFRVLLLYQTPFSVTVRQFDHLIAEYLEMAMEWRALFDEYGQQDLVYVTVPR